MVDLAEASMGCRMSGVAVFALLFALSSTAHARCPNIHAYRTPFDREPALSVRTALGGLAWSRAGWSLSVSYLDSDARFRIVREGHPMGLVLVDGTRLELKTVKSATPTPPLYGARPVVTGSIYRLVYGISEDEIRRLGESELLEVQVYPVAPGGPADWVSVPTSRRVGAKVQHQMRCVADLVL
jgi:hypothetical protein